MLWGFYMWFFTLLSFVFFTGILLFASHFGLDAVVAVCSGVALLALGTTIQWRLRNRGTR